MGEIRKVEKTGDEGQRREREREILYCTIMWFLALFLLEGRRGWIGWPRYENDCLAINYSCFRLHGCGDELFNRELSSVKCAYVTIYVYNSGSLWLVLILTGIVVSCKRMFRTILIVFEINLSPRRNARISSEEMELDPSIHLFRNDIASFRDQSTWKIRKFPFPKMNKERTGILFNIQETSKRRIGRQLKIDHPVFAQVETYPNERNVIIRGRGKGGGG